MTANRNALKVAQAYVTAVENRDRHAVAATLADDVQHVFPLAAGGAENLQALFLGKAEVLDYIDSLFAKFASLTWPDTEWTPSEDGTRAFMQARGDAIVRHSNAPYHNTYIVRFDVSNDRIVQITEYANPETYLKQGIAPTEVELRAVERAAAISAIP